MQVFNGYLVKDDTVGQSEADAPYGYFRVQQVLQGAGNEIRQSPLYCRNIQQYSEQKVGSGCGSYDEPEYFS